MQNEIQRESSLKEKLKSSICCFTGTVHHDPLEHHHHHHHEEGFYNKLRNPKTPTSPAGSTSSSWFKIKSPMSREYETPRVRSRSLRPKMCRKNNHRQSQSADFSYDPSSYALNFESECHEEFPFRNFSSRLPVSPPRIKYSGEIAGYR